jgi:hypothetical protein
MRIVGLILVGMLALSGQITAHADQAGSPIGPAGVGSTPRFVQVGDGSGSGWHPNPRHLSQWDGDGARSHWVPNHFYGFWGPPEVWGVPYVVVPYVPYRYYGDWGALWYPYAEWRGPHGGGLKLTQGLRWRRNVRPLGVGRS